MQTASNLLPSKIENVFDQPKVSELVKAVGINAILNQVEFEITKLAAMVNTGGNLNNAQIQFIAEQLIEKYPMETLADFKICFTRALTGNYGDVFRLDTIIIFGWMEKYLNEKYQVLEQQLAKGKNKRVEFTVPEGKELSPETEKLIQDYINSLSDFKKVPAMTEEEIKELGRERIKPRSVSAGHSYADIEKINDDRIKLDEAVLKRGLHEKGLHELIKFEVDGKTIIATSKEEAYEIYLEVYT